MNAEQPAHRRELEVGAQKPRGYCWVHKGWAKFVAREAQVVTFGAGVYWCCETCGGVDPSKRQR